jgi:hypothetical protein
MANPDAHLEAVRSIIASRCPELDPSDIAEAFAVDTGPMDAVLAALLEVLDDAVDRLDRLEAFLTQPTETSGLEDRADGRQRRATTWRRW